MPQLRVLSSVVRLGVASLLLMFPSNAAEKVAMLPEKDQIDTEVVELGRFGFIPSTIKQAKSGKYYLCIDSFINQDISFEIEDKSIGKKVQNTLHSKKKANALHLIDLPSGSYILQVTGHPEWRLIIDAQGGSK